MIKSAQLGKEIVVTVVNKIGVLADVSKLLTDHGINIRAVNGYAIEKNAVLRLVTEDNLRASDALKKAGYNNLAEKDAIIVELENKPGALKILTLKLAQEAIDIKYVYGSACSAGCPASIILSTSDNEKALVALKK